MMRHTKADWFTFAILIILVAAVQTFRVTVRVPERSEVTVDEKGDKAEASGREMVVQKEVLPDGTKRVTVYKK